MQRLLLILLIPVTLSLFSCSSSKPTNESTAEKKVVTLQTGVLFLSIKCDTNNNQLSLLQLQLGKKQGDKLSTFDVDKTLAIQCHAASKLLAVPLPIGTYRINTWSRPQVAPQHLIKAFYFSIKAHQVTYLGHILMTQQQAAFLVTQKNAKADIAAMRKHYPIYKAYAIRRVI